LRCAHLGSSGAEVLRCPLSGAGRALLVTLARDDGLSTWSAIAASKGSRAWWGLLANHSASPQKLRLHVDSARGARAVTVAGLDLMSRASTGLLREDNILTSIRQLQVYGDTTLLGLSRTGHAIHGWNINGARVPSRSGQSSPAPSQLGSWRIPEHLHADAICSTDRHLFVAGRRARASRAPEVWRFDLPPSLAGFEKLAQ